MEYLDICSKCLRDIPIDPIEPDGMVDTVGYDDDDEFEIDRETEEQWSYLNDDRE